MLVGAPSLCDPPNANILYCQRGGVMCAYGGVLLTPAPKGNRRSSAAALQQN